MNWTKHAHYGALAKILQEFFVLVPYSHDASVIAFSVFQHLLDKLNWYYNFKNNIYIIILCIHFSIVWQLNIDQNKYHTAGLPSLPVITQVTSGVQSAILTVQLYAGHPSVLLLNVTATNQTGGNITFANLLQSDGIQNVTEYSVELPLPPGVYHFTVYASNLFGSTASSNVFAALIDGIEGWLINLKYKSVNKVNLPELIINFTNSCLSIQSSYSYGH